MHSNHLARSGRRRHLVARCCLTAALVALFCSALRLSAVSLDILEKNFYLETARLDTLRQKSPAESTRKEWLASLAKIRRIYQMAPPKLAASCLWQMATASRDLYLRYNEPKDLDRSLVSFRDLANLFPRDMHADNALFTAAKLHQTQKNNQALATRYFQRIVALYPAGDMAAKARDELAAQPEPDLSSSRRTEYRYQPPEELKTLPTAKISQVKFWSTPYYTRIVIRSQGGTSYFSKLVDGNGTTRSSIVLDLENSVLDPSVATESPPANGPLAAISLTQHTPSSVRAVLELREHMRHKIFSLSDPFRIIIDIQGRTPPVEPKTIVPPAPVPPAPAAPPSVKEATPELPVLAPGVKVKRRPGMDTEPKTLSLAKQLGLHVGRVVLDPGHGAHDPGASGHGLVEKDLVLSIAKKTAHTLRKQYGIEVMMTRETDLFVPLEERIVMANTSRADLFVSLHINAAPRKNVRGLESYFLNLATDDNAMRLAAYENATSTHRMSELQDILTDLLNNSKKKESALLARDVQNTMISELQQNGFGSIKDLGVKQAPFYVLLGAEMPAVLVECFFLSNPYDAAFLKKETNLKLLSRSLAKGISRYIRTVNQAGRPPSSRVSPVASRQKLQPHSRL